MPPKLTPDAVFDLILDALRAQGEPPEITRKIASLKAPILKPRVPTLAAKDFDIGDAVYAFGLKYRDRPVRTRGGLPTFPKWRIEDIPETKEFVVTPCLGRSFKHSLSTVDPSLMVWLE
jgi:hypothetical protein